jgi:hypothetical protein
MAAKERVPVAYLSFSTTSKRKARTLSSSVAENCLEASARRSRPSARAADSCVIWSRLLESRARPFWSSSMSSGSLVILASAM